MAFDMYANKRREKIDHHEESLFDFLKNEKEAYPGLNDIWNKFYKNSRIQPHVSNELVHELLRVRDKALESKEYKWLEPVVIRLASFFSHAYTNDIVVECAGD